MRTKRVLEAPLDRPVIRRDLIRWIETAHADNVESFKNDLLWRLQKGMFDRTPEHDPARTIISSSREVYHPTGRRSQTPEPEIDDSVAELIGLNKK